MSFTRLQDAILEEARQQASAVEQKYADLYDKEEQHVIERAQAVEAEIIEAAEAEGVARARKLHQESELAARSAVLTAKQEELVATREAFVKDVIDSADDQLIASLMALVPSDKGEIVPGEAHKELVAKAAAKAGHTVSDEVIADDGGFVYKGASTEMNLTIQHLAEALFARHRSRIASTLFAA